MRVSASFPMRATPVCGADPAPGGGSVSLSRKLSSSKYGVPVQGPSQSGPLPKPEDCGRIPHIPVYEGAQIHCGGRHCTMPWGKPRNMTWLLPQGAWVLSTGDSESRVRPHANAKIPSDVPAWQPACCSVPRRRRSCRHDVLDHRSITARPGTGCGGVWRPVYSRPVAR